MQISLKRWAENVLTSLWIWSRVPSGRGLLEVLKRGGRYVTAGAIAGPIVELDVRTLYLKDLSFFWLHLSGRQHFTGPDQLY